MKKFIKKLFHNIRLAVKAFIFSKELWKKIWSLIVYSVEIMITGIIIYYTVTGKLINTEIPNSMWLRAGLLSALAMYYFREIVDHIKKKQE
jgi:hypothetical protein|tara:strand:- start:394 stop:666 length:273 start_codon:yes stop_codon:yes gene_type:complete